MKQTKTTLILGVLLAIVVVVLVTLEIKNQSHPQKDAKIENARVLPVAKQIKDAVVPIVKMIGTTVFVEDAVLKK